jgi:UDPglucose 6-dehydrogenase
MKIGIVGYGFVGKALFNAINQPSSVIKIDPQLGTTLHDLAKFNPDYIFICAPTPMSDDEFQDISIVRKIIIDIKKLNIKGLIVIKSTILPNYLNEIEEINGEIVYNPEFLREKSANEDFINSNLIVFGGNKKNCDSLAYFYNAHTKCISREYVFTDLITASFIKYTINTFLANKVIFFNQLNKLFNSMNPSDNWENLISYVSLDSRIGNSHMDVPGHDGRYGFGGACLPKDSKAFYEFSKSMNEPLSLLNEAIRTNNLIRSEYNTKTDREIVQNISYKNDKKD